MYTDNYNLKYVIIYVQLYIFITILYDNNTYINTILLSYLGYIYYKTYVNDSNMISLILCM